MFKELNSFDELVDSMKTVAPASPRIRSRASWRKFTSPKWKRKAKNWKINRPEDYNRMLWESQIKFKYGIEPEDVARAYEKQNKMCAICYKMLFLDKATHIDHCHKTGKFRGLLCPGCNTAMARIDSGLGERMIKYANNFGISTHVSK